MPPPFLSIVMPAFNREREIPRAVASCLSQDFDDWEVIVVDDASSDGTAEAATACQDSRIRLLRHQVNRGVCAARNAGVRAARGEWVTFLDSDDAYLEGALDMVARRARRAPADIHRVGFSCRLEQGGLSPRPHPGAGVRMDYEAYLRWSECVRVSDFHNCIRRATFETVSFPEGRIYESLYHLDFARNFDSILFAEPAVLVHSDAANRCANLATSARTRKWLGESADAARGMDRLLSAHGPALRRHAPGRYEMFSRLRILYLMLAGDRTGGLRCAVEHLRSFPASATAWSILLVGMAGPTPLAWAASARERRRPRHAAA